jgi:hypothetical protein
MCLSLSDTSNIRCGQSAHKKRIEWEIIDEFDTGRSPFLSQVAQKVGVYTAKDYADIVEHLVRFWKVAERSGLSPEAEAMQEYLCRLPARVSSLADRLAAKAKKKPGRQSARFSWIFNREVPLL